MSRHDRKTWPLWLTVEETAKLLRVSRSAVYEKVNQGLLPVFRIGNAIRIERDALFRQARKELAESIEEVAKKVV